MSEWNGFERVDFEFLGREAILIFPKYENKTAKWALKTEYFNAFPQTEIDLLTKGYHLAYLKNRSRWCNDDDMDAKFEFCKFLSEKYGLTQKCVPVGMSCGGLHAVKFAEKYPQCVSVLYLDAPVLNLLSCPAGVGKADFNTDFWSEFVAEVGMSMSQLICYRDHPIDKMDVLITHNIPVIMVYGNVDTVVPYCENGAILEKYYKENNGVIQVICKENCEHHPHGLDDNKPIVDFILQHS